MSEPTLEEPVPPSQPAPDEPALELKLDDAGVGVATALAAQDEGLTEARRTRESLLDEATKKIRAARDHAEALVSAGIISLPPENAR